MNHLRGNPREDYSRLRESRCKVSEAKHSCVVGMDVTTTEDKNSKGTAPR